MATPRSPSVSHAQVRDDVAELPAALVADLDGAQREVADARVALEAAEHRAVEPTVRREAVDDAPRRRRRRATSCSARRGCARRTSPQGSPASSCGGSTRMGLPVEPGERVLDALLVEHAVDLEHAVAEVRREHGVRARERADGRPAAARARTRRARRRCGPRARRRSAPARRRAARATCSRGSRRASSARCPLAPITPRVRGDSTRCRLTTSACASSASLVDALRAGLGGALVGEVLAPREDVHAERVAVARHARADAAEADEAERLAREHEAGRACRAESGPRAPTRRPRGTRRAAASMRASAISAVLSTPGPPSV